jgi:hypothetical protein
VGVEHELLLDDLGLASPYELGSVVAGVRLYLDIETLLHPPRLRPLAAGRPDCWPRRREVYYGHRFQALRKMPQSERSKEADLVEHLRNRRPGGEFRRAVPYRRYGAQ